MRYLVAALLLAPVSTSVAQQPTAPPPARQVDTSSISLNVDTVANPVLDLTDLDERPDILSGPPLRYPDRLRKNGITGRVIVQLIIDTSGRAEPKSIVIIATPDPGFDESAREYVRGARFRPGKIGGKAVRTRVILPIDFAIVIRRG
jgi:periplasmic protein TonB